MEKKIYFVTKFIKEKMNVFWPKFIQQYEILANKMK